MRYFALVSFLAAAAFAQTAEEFYSRAQQSLADKQMDKVVEECTRAILLEPGFQEALILRATAYSNLNQRDRAVADLDIVLKEHPRAVTFVFRGNQHMLLKKYDLALADFNEAIRRMPSRSGVYEMRAEAKMRLGDIVGAGEDRAKAADQVSPSRIGYSAKAGQETDPKSTVYKIGGGVSAPKVISQKEPLYTEDARAAKIQGAVVVTLVVDEAGLPRDIRVVRPLGNGLDEKAIEAVLQWRFKPSLKDGHPVAVHATIEVNFRLL